MVAGIVERFLGACRCFLDKKHGPKPGTPSLVTVVLDTHPQWQRENEMNSHFLNTKAKLCAFCSASNAPPPPRYGGTALCGAAFYEVEKTTTRC